MFDIPFFGQCRAFAASWHLANGWLSGSAKSEDLLVPSCGSPRFLVTPQPVRLNITQSRENMGQEFQYDVFLSHTAKDKAVVRPPVEGLPKDGLNAWVSETLHSAFILLRFPIAPIKGFLTQSLYLNRLPQERETRHSLSRQHNEATSSCYA